MIRLSKAGSSTRGKFWYSWELYGYAVGRSEIDQCRTIATVYFRPFRCKDIRTLSGKQQCKPTPVEGDAGLLNNTTICPQELPGKQGSEGLQRSVIKLWKSHYLQVCPCGGIPCERTVKFLCPARVAPLRETKLGIQILTGQK
jgi:hypothetical protein